MRLNHHHSEHYAVLAFILALGVLGLAWFRSDINLQQIVVWTMAGLYIVWGIGHHLLRKDFTLLILAEYVLIALIAAGSIQAILFNR